MLISTIATTSTIASAQTATPTPAPTPVYVATPSHDTWVWDFAPTANYSLSSALYYRTHPTRNIITYIYPGIPNGQNINSARLWMWFYLGETPQSVALHQTWPVNNSTTYNNRPPSLGLIEIVTPTIGWFSVDITDTVRQGRSVALIGAKDTIQQTYFRSIEHTMSPYVMYSFHATPTPLATATPSPTPLPTSTPIPPDYTIELPDNKEAELWLTMTAGEFAITVTLMLALVPLVLLVFQNWGREISDRY
jgi:hypothetical protein